MHSSSITRFGRALCCLALSACSSSNRPSTQVGIGAGGGASGPAASISAAGGSVGSMVGGTSSGAGGAGAVVNPPVVLPAGAITYYQHTAPIIIGKCAGCHQAGAIAPFALTTYAEAKQWAPAMLGEIDAGRMPPWGAVSTGECQPRFNFKHDRRLSDMEKALLHAWLDTGLLEGDATTAAALPPISSLDLADANATVKMTATASVSGTSDQFICFPLDPQLGQDVWLTGTQVNPGNKLIVHHVLVFDDPSGESVGKAAANGGQYNCSGGPDIGQSSLLAAWAPGATAALTPADVGIPLKAGSKLVMQVHYHPTGASAQMDSETSVSLRWSTTEPKYTGSLSLIGNFQRANEQRAGGVGYGLLPGPNDAGSGAQFLIPAGVKDHTETQRYLIPGGAQAAALGVKYYLWGAGTHMHYVGRDMKLDVHRPNPSATQPADECLLQTPSWNFNWQGAYFYDAPLLELPTLSPGDELRMRCTYDNTLSNPFLPAALDSQGLKAPVDVKLGETTLDEMCLGIFGIAIDSRQAAALP